jgi:predicted dehydrogenase
MMPRTRIGIVGTGYVAPQYARTLVEAGMGIVCYDIDPARQSVFAAEFGAEQVSSLAGLADRDVTVAVNLTPPAAHRDVTAALLQAGVPVYSEKPLAVTVAEAAELISLSRATGVPLACAPDTILGATQQRLRHAVDEGLIGRPLWMNGQVSWGDHENWHPRPTFFYQRGGGPLLDLGPYWITAMINVAGPVTAVTAVSSPVVSTRSWRRPDDVITEIVPEISTTYALLLRFSDGIIASLLTSFDLPNTVGPALEIVGDEGSLLLREPLFRGRGPVEHRARNSAEWTPLPASGRVADWVRGIGVLEFIDAIGQGGQSRLDAELALHVVEVFETAATGSGASWGATNHAVPRPRPYIGPER